MSRYNGRSNDHASYRDRGSFSDYGKGFDPSSRRETFSLAASDLDGLTPFEKDFYTESPSVGGMIEDEVEEYRRNREITFEGSFGNPFESFGMLGFLIMLCKKLTELGLLSLRLSKHKDGLWL